MRLNSKLLLAALFMGVLALAGCGGGSDAPTEPPTTAPEPDGPSPLQNAVDAQEAAENALAEANKLLKAADAASKKLSAKDVNGSSQMASANAMTVLAAEAAIQAEYDKADAAHTKATAAHTAAADADKARIMSIVTAVKADRDAIKAIQDATDKASLAEAIKRVKTGRPIGDSNAKIAQAKADAVGTAIRNALLTSEGGAQSIGITAATGSPKGAVMTVGGGMTFAQINGGATTKVATSVKDFNSGATGTTAFTLPTGTDTTNFNDGDKAANYMGIPGSLKCIVGSCSFDKDGKITGSVHFAPTNPATLYTRANYGDPYTAATNGASYGHWLSTADGGATTINLHAATLSTALDWDRNEGDGSTNTIDVKAGYSGDASGYSAKNTGTRAKPKYASGEFTAKVDLDAVFGESDLTLKGSISGFSGGAHVNPNWYVNLPAIANNASLDDGTAITDANMVGKEDATGGQWRAYGYGAAGKNPSGFVGTFNAAFDDGGAAGTYHATKD